MRFKAIIFDLDGTLLDSLHDLANSYNRALAKNKFPTHSVDAYRRFIGDGARICAKRALPPESRDIVTINNILRAFRKDYAQNWNIHTKPYKDIPEMISGLSNQGFKMAILSNKPQEDTERCVRNFFPHWKFEAVFGQRNHIPKKPHPAAALHISTLMGVPTEKILFLGDTSIDMKTAISAAMYPVGALWGFRSLDELIKSGAKLTIKSPLNLLSLFC